MRKIALFILALLIFLIISSIIIYNFVDINNYKSNIISAFKTKTGTEIDIQGDIRLRLIPDIALDISDVSIKPNNQENGKPIYVKKIILNLKLLPLIKRNLEIGSLRVVRPKIYFTIFKDGTTSLSRNVEPPADSVQEPNKNYKIERDLINKNIVDQFKFSEIIFEDAELTYTDERHNFSFAARDVEIQTSFLPNVNKFQISGHVNINSNAVKEPFQINGNYLLANDLYELTELVIKLGKVEAHGEAIADFNPTLPDIKLAIYFTNMDLTPYSSLIDPILEQYKKPEEQNETANEKSFAWKNENIDFSTLRKFNVHFSFKTNKVSYKDINIGSITLNSYLVNGKLTASLKEAEILDGNITGELIIDTTSDMPKIRQKINLEQVDFSAIPIKRKIFDNIVGKISGGTNLTSRGISEKELVNNIDGNLSFKVDDGYIRNVDLIGISQNLVPAFGISPDKKTDFKELAGEFDVNNGVIKTDHFTFTSELLDFNSAGILNLPELNINLRMVPKIKNTSNQEDKLGGISLPVLISGSIFEPSFNVEIKNVVEDFIKNPEGTDILINNLKRTGKDSKKSNDIIVNSVKDSVKDILKNIP